MNKRQMWIMNCLVWAGIWFVMGLFFIPLWFFSFVSATMLFLPVGVSETPHPKHVHNPDAWGQHGSGR